MTLSEAQPASLERLTKTGKAPANQIRHAQILWHADRGPQGPGCYISQISETFGMSQSTVSRVCQRFRQQGLAAALLRRPQPERPQKRKLDGEAEAHLLALLWSQKPEGGERWSLRPIGEKLVELEIVEGISHETVRQVLKKTNSSPG